MIAGSIDLDRSGLAREMTGVDDGPAGRQARPKLRSSAPEPPEARRCRPSRHRRGPGEVRRRAGPGAGAEPRPPVPPDRHAPRQPRAAISALGRLDDPPGGLPRGGRTDRAGAAPAGRAGGPAPRDGGDAPSAPRRAVPGAARPRRPEKGGRGVRQGAGRRPGRDADRRHAAGPDRRPARPVRPRAVAPRRGPFAGQGRRDGRASRRADARGEGPEGRGPRCSPRRGASTPRVPSSPGSRPRFWSRRASPPRPTPRSSDSSRPSPRTPAW